MPNHITNEKASEVKNYVISIFKKIQQASSINELIEIEFFDDIPEKNRMKTESYPMIDFYVTPNEIQKLRNEGILDDKHNFSCLITSNLGSSSTDTLLKILYAVSWKNGDLHKIKHIINGVVESDSKEIKQNNALVFHQFGKHLANRAEPIIDQHVIRAFAVFNYKVEEVNRFIHLEVIDKSHKQIIIDYKMWLENGINQNLKTVHNYIHHIDKILFAVGKTIKEMSKLKSV